MTERQRNPYNFTPPDPDIDDALFFAIRRWNARARSDQEPERHSVEQAAKGLLYNAMLRTPADQLVAADPTMAEVMNARKLQALVEDGKIFIIASQQSGGQLCNGYLQTDHYAGPAVFVNPSFKDFVEQEPKMAESLLLRHLTIAAVAYAGGDEREIR